ncbi:hemagglutinin repeat-containing protein, partial [Leptotrichia sp. OH3620_COT-345]|uniref:hemagglutinin repeat-containing protein n=1 Tax=Leptotrichia sp. OH3620_COT-345 TaxID=2491048 RepID=UPI001315A174
MDSEGKLKVVGADIQTARHVYLRGKKGLEILPGVEKSLREEEHKVSGIKGSIKVGWNGINAGVGYGKSEDRIREVRSDIISNKLNVVGNVTLKSDEGNIDLGPTNGIIGGKLTYTGKDIRILDMHSERIIDGVTKNTYVGAGINVGIPIIGAAQQVWEAGKGLKRAKHKEDYINGGFGAYNAGMNMA